MHLLTNSMKVDLNAYINGEGEESLHSMKEVADTHSTEDGTNNMGIFLLRDN